MNIKYSHKRKQSIKNKTKKNYKRKKYKSINKNKNLKRKQHKYILKGGNMNIAEASSFNNLPPSNNFNAIYIAIGGKYHTDYPRNIENLGSYELFPDFLFKECQQNNLSKALIIIIDEFNKDDLEINKKMARIKYNSNKDSVDNMDTEYTFVFVNLLFDDSLVNPILMYLANKREDAKLWICNYVYFFNPNAIEKEIVKKVNNSIKQLAGPNNIYTNDIYGWTESVDLNYVVNINYQAAIPIIIYNSRTKPISEKQKIILQHNLLDISGKDVYQINPLEYLYDF